MKDRCTRLLCSFICFLKIETSAVVSKPVMTAELWSLFQLNLKGYVDKLNLQQVKVICQLFWSRMQNSTNFQFLNCGCFLLYLHIQTGLLCPGSCNNFLCNTPGQPKNKSQTSNETLKSTHLSAPIEVKNGAEYNRRVERCQELGKAMQIGKCL